MGAQAWGQTVSGCRSLEESGPSRHAWCCLQMFEGLSSPRSYMLQRHLLAMPGAWAPCFPSWSPVLTSMGHPYSALHK